MNKYQLPLSKSDFKIASSCKKKLIYKKKSYPTSNDSSEYMETLANGGYIVSKYAQLLYPTGIEITGNTIDEVITKTRNMIEGKNDIILYEAAFLSEEKFIRVDIFEKKGNVINLIEVKSKSYDSENPIIKKKEIEDVAFQAMILKELYPGINVCSYLLVPDKSKRTNIEGLAGYFKIEMVASKFECDEFPSQMESHFKKPLVKLNCPDKLKGKVIKKLMKKSLLVLISVDERVKEVETDIETRSKNYIKILKSGITKDDYGLSKNCKDCEFNLGDEKIKNGYRECWKKIGDVTPHIFDLYRGGSIKHDTKWYFDKLISKGRISLFNINKNYFKGPDGNLGRVGKRQLMQIIQTKKNEELICEGLKGNLDSLKYPLHFIDFETYIGAIPHHKNMRPYEVVAFQWSCHTIKSVGKDPEHFDYLNDKLSFPNFRFAEKLMEQINTNGTILVWSKYEITILSSILEQMSIHNYENKKLKRWLRRIYNNQSTLVVDMNELTYDYYFHPEMKGKTSIKKVLPAIWKNNEELRIDPWFKKYVGNSLNPYDSLEPLETDVDLADEEKELEKNEVVKDGTGAMKAYHQLMFGDDSKNKKEKIKTLLRQYCELDTMAMVLIWKYWMNKFALT